MEMLMLSLYVTISSCLILTTNQASTEVSHIQKIENHKNLNSTPAASDNDERKIGRRRTHIWFAVPFENRNDEHEIVECVNSSNDFPNFFTHEQRLQGAIVLPIIGCLYCFCLIAIVCDNYFIPCVERICETLQLSEDVAAATFMAIATSAPELFVNVIGTFVTHSDIGIGTIVGSSMFNTIGVASIGGLAAPYPIKIAWWPVTRDIILYIISVSFLVVITWDGEIYWYEALVLFIGYFVYFYIMVMNRKMTNAIHTITTYFKGKGKNDDTKAISQASISTNSSYKEEPKSRYVEENIYESNKTITDFKEDYNIYRLPKSGHLLKAYFIFSWPIRFFVYYTIPDCRKYPKWYPLTFIMCIVWIAVNSYVISWMMTIIGITFGIPDAVLGLTFLAIGGCLPESFSIAILSMRGEGRMGVSNALGANTLNILLSLGLPWFIKTVAMGADSSSFIRIESGSIEYTILGLIIVALTLYISLIFTKFHLSRASGAITLTCYFGFLALAIVADTVFFKSDCV